jgi:hypothetical protein
MASAACGGGDDAGDANAADATTTSAAAAPTTAPTASTAPTAEGSLKTTACLTPGDVASIVQLESAALALDAKIRRDMNFDGGRSTELYCYYGDDRNGSLPVRMHVNEYPDQAQADEKFTKISGGQVPVDGVGDRASVTRGETTYSALTVRRGALLFRVESQMKGTAQADKDQRGVVRSLYQALSRRVG